MAVTSPYFSVLTERDVKVIRFSRADVVDAAYIEKLGTELEQYLADVETPRAVINMENVSHLSSAALGMLLKINTAVTGRGGGLRIADVTPDIKKVFKITKLNKVLKVVDNVKTGVDQLAA